MEGEALWTAGGEKLKGIIRIGGQMDCFEEGDKHG